MCEHYGYEVRRLRRERFVHIELGTLKVGYWRNLAAEELRQLLGQSATSSANR